VADSYDGLAGVYDWLVPEAVLTPEGAVEAFAGPLAVLDAGAPVLDCACGTGQLAVGLALRGFPVVASDASHAMVARTRALAARYAIDLAAVACDWESLAHRGWDGSFDAVLCVGNSLMHAAGKTRRRAALAGMAGVLREGGLLVVTSRNWERVRERGSGLQVGDRLTERGGTAALTIHGWSIADSWEDPHFLDVAVALLDGDSGVTTHRERLSIWPFRHDELDDDLRAAGLSPESSTYADEVERYLVTAHRRADAPTSPGLSPTATP